MKKTLIISVALLITLSNEALAQKKHPHHHHNHHISSYHNNFFGGVLTGFLFSELFGVTSSQSYRQMFFSYRPHKNTWKLQRDFTNYSNIFHKKKRVVAKFENPNGGRDFFVTINKRGQWELDCPKKLAKLFKNKVLKNL